MKTLFLSLLFFATISIGFAATPQPTVEAPDNTKESVSFTLRNNSLKSIPLLIPGVMNPNLSPKSNSGVTLKIGQEVLFRYKGKKRVLLVVDNKLEGQTIEVSKLLKEKKQEIDTQKGKS